MASTVPPLNFPFASCWIAIRNWEFLEMPADIWLLLWSYCCHSSELALFFAASPLQTWISETIITDFQDDYVADINQGEQEETWVWIGDCMLPTTCFSYFYLPVSPHYGVHASKRQGKQQLHIWHWWEQCTLIEMGNLFLRCSKRFKRRQAQSDAIVFCSETLMVSEVTLVLVWLCAGFLAAL